MAIVNVNEFRSQMKAFLDRSEAGEDVIISRTKDRYYKIVPYKSKQELVLSHIRSLAAGLRNAKVILFGSRARGDARADSDWDILIVLDKENAYNDDYEKYAFPFAALGWETDEEINPLLYYKDEWEKRSITPFYNSVMKEGIVLC